MKVICTNIGPEDQGGQVEWSGLATGYTQEIDSIIKTAFVKNDETEEYTAVSRVEDGHIFVYELDDTDRRALAEKHITEFYPIWRQLNILRSGTTEEKNKMGTFIDDCRDWSNNTENNDPFGLNSINP